jgi:hypothetical protein
MAIIEKRTSAWYLSPLATSTMTENTITGNAINCTTRFKPEKVRLEYNVAKVPKSDKSAAAIAVIFYSRQNDKLV